MDIKQFVQKIENRTPTILGSENFVEFAVLLPLIEKENDVHILFEVRSSKLRRQPGEICFPGGKVDKEDKNVRHTAIRETIEELRINEEYITNIVPLDYLVTPFGTIIYPFIGIINNQVKLNPNPEEVEEVFTVPLSFFIKNKPQIYKIKFKVEPEENFPVHDIIGGENYKWQVRSMDECFYYYENRVIWGLTAGIIKHYVELLET